jgi:hypothetical protein
VSLSSTEAEYKALSNACKDVIWVQNPSAEILLNHQATPAIVLVDNRGAIDLALSQVSQNGFWTKHMDLWLHFIRDLITRDLVKIVHVSSQKNFADFLTKPVGCTTISRAISTFASSAPSISALCSQARSMPACQNENTVAMHSAEIVMRSICKHHILS